jgi:uncharacterized protein DUF4129
MLVAAALFSAAPTCRAAAAGQPAAVDAGRPSDSEIVRALEDVKRDPNLSPERKVRTLSWIGSRKQAPRAPWLMWIVQTALWFAESARRLMWIAGGVLLALVIPYLFRRRQRRRGGRVAIDVTPPTHVRDLDIRPETLPADVGGAARALWDGGDRRAALALLYRGVLSRLIHVHRVPIRDSSTEGDCLELAASHLTEAPRQYAAGVIRAWQRFVYGGEQIQTSVVQALCDEFSRALDGTAAPHLQRASA